jgi:hypothetical protein
VDQAFCCQALKTGGFGCQSAHTGKSEMVATIKIDAEIACKMPELKGPWIAAVNY